MNAQEGAVHELEVKAPVAEPALLRRRLVESGAVAEFEGLMEDRLFDRAGDTTARDEVVRVRTWRPAGAPARAQVAWKGPTRRSADGYKLRDELEFSVAGDGTAPTQFLAALGYEVWRAVDRFVEVYRVHEAEVRLEWYPRMDVMVEVEGTPVAIEAAIGVSGLPRVLFEPEPLAEFVRRYELRTGEPAVLALAELKEGRPQWERR
jgi:adenylate cyclase class IV